MSVVKVKQFDIEACSDLEVLTRAEQKSMKLKKIKKQQTEYPVPVRSRKNNIIRQKEIE
jgi:hypothetical protein